MTHKHIITFMTLITFNPLAAMNSKAPAPSRLLDRAIKSEQLDKDAQLAQLLQFQWDREENSTGSISPTYHNVNQSPDSEPVPILKRSESSKGTYRPPIIQGERGVHWSDQSPVATAIPTASRLPVLGKWYAIESYQGQALQRQPIVGSTQVVMEVYKEQACSSSAVIATPQANKELSYADLNKKLSNIELEFNTQQTNIIFSGLHLLLLDLSDIQKTLEPHRIGKPPFMMPTKFQEIDTKRIILTKSIWNMIDRHDGSLDADPAPLMQAQAPAANSKYEITYDQDLDRAIKLSLR